MPGTILSLNYNNIILFFFHTSFGNAYAGSSTIGKNSVCAVCPSIHLSLVMENKEKMDNL